MADTRKDKRAPVSLKVRFKSATVDEFIEHYSKDVSRGGIYIKSSQPMPVGTLLKFQFQLKDESALIRGVGRVVWTRIEADAEAEQPAGMGIKFIKMDNDSRAMVERIVDSHADERGTYESGRYNATSAEPTSSAPPPQHTGADGGSFFPDLPTAELPLPEDRTAVRQATEFLAAALTEGGTDEAAAKEAQLKAEEARRRTEEVEAQRREEAEAKRKLEAEARASLAPKAPEPEADSFDPDAENDTAPTPRTLPSMIIDPSLGPRAGRASEQMPGSDVTPLPRPNVAIGDAQRSANEPPEPDTEPPPPVLAGPRAPTTSIPQLGENEPAKRGYLPYLVLAAVLLVGAFVFLRGDAQPREQSVAGDKPAAQDETVREVEAAPTPVPPVEEAVPAAVEPSEQVDAQVAPAAAAAEGLTPHDVQLFTVEVVTSPRGAEIWVGDQQSGVSPVSLKLRAGEPVVVRAKAKGYREAREELTPVKRTKLALKLESLPYTVHFESTPPGAEISVGAYKGVAPLDIAFDPPPTGMLAVNAKLDGYEPEKTKLKLDAFSESDGAMRAALSLTLQPSLPKDVGEEAAPAVSPKERAKKPAASAKKVEAPAVEGETPKAEEPAPAKVEEPRPEEPRVEEPKAPEPAKPAEPLPDNPFAQ